MTVLASYRALAGILVYGTICLFTCCRSVVADGIHHYVFFDRERGRIHDPAFLRTEAFAGAQLKYTWRELEPRPDAYDFRDIRKDLDFLATKGKRLFIQLQDASFTPSIFCVPEYLMQDPQFNGGADKQYN